ncbi:MAG: MlaD family protein [Verrucomicrobiota bacterium]
MKNTLETRLGVFFAMALLAAVLVFEMIGGLDFLKGGYRLHGLFNNVSELKIGDPVKMAGKQIGKVEEIDFEGDKVKVTMKIESKYPVRTDSKATIKFAGLLGQNFVAVNIGKATTTFVDNAIIETAEQPDLSTLMAKLENVATGVENVTKSFSGDSIQNVLGPLTDFMKDNRIPLTAMIGNMRNVSDQIAQGKGTIGKLIADEALYNSALDTVKSLNSTADDLKATMGDAKGIFTDAKAALNEAQGAMADARKIITNVNAGEGSIGKLLKDEKLYAETTTAMTNLKEILEKINQGQGSVGKLVNDISFYNNVKLTLQKVDKATEGLEDTGPLSVLGTAVNSLF